MDTLNTVTPNLPPDLNEVIVDTKKPISFERNTNMNNFMGLARKINEMVKQETGESFNLDVKERHKGKYFTVQDKKSKFNGRKIKLNSTVPSEELFSIAQELVKPKDEPFAAREIFGIDSSYHEGSQTIGYDVIQEGGRATLIAAGSRGTTDIRQSDATVGRRLQSVGKIATFIEVTRDDLQIFDLRRDRGLGPLVSLLEEKLRIARKNVSRTEDAIVWAGGKLKTGGATNEIEGFLDRFSTTLSNSAGSNPSAGRQEAVATVDTDKITWASKIASAAADAGPDAVIADIRKGAEYLIRLGAFEPNMLVLPYSITNLLALTRLPDTNSTPLLEWIIRAIEAAYGPLTVKSSNALFGSTDDDRQQNFTGNAFCLMDSNQSHQAIAVVEDMTLLPSKEDEMGTIKQVVQMKTGGIMVKHPAAAYLGTGI